MRIRVGLVGAGGGGARHASVLSGFEDVEVVGVWDADRATAAALAADVGATPAPDLAGLLDRRPDAVWLCVPPFAHGELELTLVRAGIPFFVEKPLAADLPVAERVAAAVTAAALPTATGYHWRHLDTVDHAQVALAGRTVRLGEARRWGTAP